MKKHDEATLYLTNERTVFFEQAAPGQITVTASNFALTPNEVIAVAVISETLRCLSEGRDLNLYFNPTEDRSNRTTMVRCRWERNGNLRVIQEGVQGKFLLCHTVEDAMAARRSFTVYKTLLRDLPSRRGPIVKKPKEIKS